MSAGQRHVVGSALFELEVPEEGPAVAECVRGRLLPLAEAIFDEFDEPGRVIRIDRLELDLREGPAGGDWQGELERRFGEALRGELRRRRSGASVPSSVADLDVLTHVLRTGTLPWAGGWGGDGSLDAFAGRVILAEPRGFARWLGRLGRGGPELRRLVRQASDDTLAVALAALSGGRVAEWKNLVGRLDGALREGGRARSEREVLRGDLLATLLWRLGRSEPGPAGVRPTTPSPQAGSPGLLALLDAALRSGPGDVAAAWERALAGRASMGGVAAPAMPKEHRAGTGGVPEAAGGDDTGEAGDAGGEALPHRVTGEGGTSGPEQELIVRRLGEALRSGALSSVLPHLSGWVRGHPEAVAAVVRQAATQRRVRRLLAVALPDAAFLDVVGVLAPGSPEEVARVLDDPTGLVGGPAAGAGAPGWAPGSLRSALREFTLAHLVVDAPRWFVPGSYRRALRLRMALEGLADGPEQDPGAPPEPPSPYATLHRLLLPEGDDDSADADLEAVLQGHPDDLMRLLETLRRDPGGDRGSALDRVAGWPAARVRRLTEGLLAAVARDAPDGGRELRGAVRKVGDQVADPRRFDLRVIQALVDGGWIDLERLREADGTPAAPDSGRPHPGPGPGGTLGSGISEGRGGTRPGRDAPGAPLLQIRRLLSSLVESEAGGAGAEGTSGAGDPAGPPSREGDTPSSERGLIPAQREFRAALDLALAADAAGLRRLLEQALEEETAADALVGALPGPTLGRVLLLLRPGAGDLLRAMDAVAGAGASLGIPFATAEREKWLLLFRHLVTQGGIPEPGRMARALLDRILSRRRSARAEGRPVPTAPAPSVGGPLPEGVDRGRILEAIRQRMASGILTTPEVGARVLSALSEPRDSLDLDDDGPKAEPGPQTAGPVRQGPADGGRDRSGDEPGESGGREDPPLLEPDTLFVSNAGIVLAAPYLPSLFDRLGLTTAGAFRSGEHAARAVHLVQYLVEGRVDRPEHLLTLNKLLCGLGEDDVIPAAIELAPGEEEVLQGLLSAILQHWGALGNTTVQGLQESFFQREGALRREGEAWRLQVEPRPFDMLIDRIPWSFGLIRFGWMDRVLHVDWRG